MPAIASAMVTRRSLLSGRPRPEPERIRPPWTTAQTLADCTGCAACVSACPENILRLDADRRPHVELDGGACTFCAACASACESGVFRAEASDPWPVRAVLNDGCLMTLGISCRLCTDACDSGALLFDLSSGPVGAIRLAADRCTGCGACIGTCPVEALSLHDDRLEYAR